MLRLLVEYWECDSSERQEELDESIQTNIESGLFDEIYIFSEDFTDKFHGANLIVGERKTVKDIFEFANEIVSSDDVTVIANTDIIFDSSINFCKSMENQEFFCITRHENVNEVHQCFGDSDGNPISVESEPQQNVFSCSSDAWCWKGNFNLLEHYFLKNNIFEFGKYYLGFLGVDNCIALDCRFCGYEVSDPCFEVKILHNHKSNSRSGTSSDETRNLLIERHGSMVPFYGSGDRPVIMHWEKLWTTK